MKLSFTASVIALALIATGANAKVLKFTATSAASGELGYFKLDVDKLDGSEQQRVKAVDLLEIRFQDPVSHFLATTPGVGSVIIDSSGYFTVVHIPPTMLGSADGYPIGNGFTGGVSFAGPTNLLFFTGDFDDEPFFSYRDVTWKAAVDVQAVPEPSSWAMMIGGFGLLGAALRRRTTAVRFA